MLPTQTTIPAKVNFVFVAQAGDQKEQFLSGASDYRTAQEEVRAHFGTHTEVGEYIKINFVRKTFGTIMP